MSESKGNKDITAAAKGIAICLIAGALAMVGMRVVEAFWPRELVVKHYNFICIEKDGGHTCWRLSDD